ncbi:GGDEF domain-containing protein [Dyella nitratireducens]|uniref:diguanylate cyclase n=1 Tax=Dyella nitratireducens TaxID=1849580 RepID=A0ABQ1FT30_9GAMM|nr:GGDEF domain-containing protein [Dyella nitratireducens]GLQ43077.1 GGDEF domain-containing protein [Dyella nitratireducens]
MRLKDHSRFVQMLEQIHQESSSLSESEQWHLRYLDAWEAQSDGNYAQSELQFRQVIDHSGDPELIGKASARLLKILSLNRHYDEAFVLANHLASTLPQVKDAQVRFDLLTELSEMLDFADQTDLALQYARMAEDAIPPGETSCFPLMLQAAALYNGKRLTSASPEPRQAIDACTTAGDLVSANAIWLVLGSMYIDGNQPLKALDLLDQIGPSIRTAGYYPHLLSSQVERAQAYLKSGNDDEAKKAALAALAISHPDDTGDWVMTDYQVLYQIEKKQRHDAAALAYHERFSTLEKNHLDDVHARALAYDMAEQHLLVQKMQTEGLSKQNSILKLQQALTGKAVETSRLYIALLLLMLVSVVFWLFRLKRSQLRFKELSSLDGLTGIFNYQHFISEASRTLQILEKRRSTACVIAIDLDHFKQINDTYGHALGDTVLKRTVAICRHQLRPDDLFGRLGGEEFCVLLSGCHRNQGMAIADCIRKALAATLVDVEGGVVSFSASFGLACTDTSGYELQRLCKDADAALYKAKRTGRNQVVASGEHIDQVQAQHAEKWAS